MKMQCRDLAEQAQIAEQAGWKSPALARGLAMTAIAASLAFATSAFADDAHHPQQAPEPGAVPTEPAAPTVQKMQDNVKKMQAQLDRIAAAKTDEERQKAMAEHMQTMQENMKMASGMRAGMMDCPMMGKGGMGMMGGNSPDAMAKHMEQMEKRMDMMQMMMEQMTKSASMPMPAK
jgi:hypothetical protein